MAAAKKSRPKPPAASKSRKPAPRKSSADIKAAERKNTGRERDMQTARTVMKYQDDQMILNNRAADYVIKMGENRRRAARNTARKSK